MTNKRVELILPVSKKVLHVEGNSNDKSIIGAIESAGGFYESHIMGFLNKLIKKNSICLDIGANIGVITLCIAQIAKDGKVYAFEPSENNYQYLNKNIKINKLKNVIPINLGLYDKKCNLSFSYVEHVAGCSFISEESGIHEGVTEIIRCEKLDDFIYDHKIKRVDFIKLDVEGAEVKALNGAYKTIMEQKPDLIIEFNPVPLKRFFNEDPSRLFSLLKKFYPWIYLIPFSSGPLIEIKDYKMLMKLVGAGKGWEDLFCSYRAQGI